MSQKKSKARRELERDAGIVPKRRVAPQVIKPVVVKAAPPAQKKLTLWKTWYQRKDNSLIRALVEGWNADVVRYRRTEHGELFQLKTSLFRANYKHMPGFVEPEVRFGTLDFDYSGEKNKKPVQAKKRVRASSAERVATLKKSWQQRSPNPVHREESLH